MKKILSLVLSALILVCVIPIGAITVGAETYGDYITYTISNGAVTITDCNTSVEGAFIIPDTIDNYPVTAIGSSAFEGCGKLTEITIPKSITSMGASAFNGTNLQKIYIESLEDWCKINFSSPNSSIFSPNPYAEFYVDGELITDLVIPGTVSGISDYAFYLGAGFKSITIENGVERVGKYTFSMCRFVTEINIPPSIKTIDENAFATCTAVTEVNITDLGAWCSISFANNYSSPVKDNLKLNGSLVTQVVIPEGVKAINGAFMNCSQITSVSIPEGVEAIGGYSFYGCSKINNIDIPKSVKSIGEYAFYKCSSLTTVKIPDGVTYINSNTFNYCTGLTSVDLPEGITGIAGYAFGNCTKLTNIEIPETVTFFGGSVFYGCSALKSLSLPFIGNSPHLNNYLDFFFGGSSNTSTTNKVPYSLKTVVLLDNCTAVKNNTFYYCRNLTNIVIGDGVESIGENAMYYCTSLKSVTIGENVKTISNYAFYTCYNLTDVYYHGTQAEWKKITIGTNNDYLKSATIHYISDGDLDCDSDINADDLTILRKLIITGGKNMFADMNGDSKINLRDLVNLKKQLVGIK